MDPHGDGDLERSEARALLRRLNADLLSHPSATRTLERWCAAQASGARVSARRVTGVDKPADAERRRLLAAGPDEPVRYRRVRLFCGGRLLSEADNWYVPARLTPAMNRALDGSDLPFGRVVRALRFQRRTLSARPLSPPPAVLEHRAVLVLPDGTPISTVVETYMAAVLALRRPPRP